MGIRGFFVFFNYLLETKSLKEYKGKRIGIDAFVWLHKAVFSGLELAYNKNGVKFIQYIINNIKHIKSFGIIPIIVFDGSKVGMKSKESNARKIKREMTKGSNCKDIIKKIEINFNMTYKVIQALKILKVEYIVAPYEADAELAHLFKIGYIDAVMTEDSDMFAYGVTSVLLKYSRKNDYIETINFKALISRFEDYNQFLEFCILCGCDFFKIKGIGTQSAYKMIRKYRSFALCPFDKDTNFKFFMAKFLFLNQTIYCPIKRIMKPLNNFFLIDINEIEEYYYKKIKGDCALSSLYGEVKPGDIAMLIAKGIVEPNFS